TDVHRQIRPHKTDLGPADAVTSGRRRYIGATGAVDCPSRRRPNATPQIRAADGSLQGTSSTPGIGGVSGGARTGRPPVIDATRSGEPTIASPSGVRWSRYLATKTSRRLASVATANGSWRSDASARASSVTTPVTG